jgi:hypothetical protein
MRDSSAGMIEIVDSLKMGDTYFSVIRLSLNDELFTLKFGISADDYSRIRNIVTFRPFENSGAGEYRYYFAKSYSRGYVLSKISVRVEQLKQHKQFEFPVSKGYIANLLWFGQIKERAILNPFEVRI